MDQGLYNEFSKRKDGQPLAIVKKNGEPLSIMRVDDNFKLAIFKGKLSDYDIIIKYRQKQFNNKWSSIRTPKHIHWVVDLLIKFHIEPTKTKKLLKVLIDLWDETKGFKNENERLSLSFEKILLECSSYIEEFDSLNGKGEYSIKFIILMARLLMIQEKSNYEGAYMFRNVLESLFHGYEIFKIVSAATHTGKR